MLTRRQVLAGGVAVAVAGAVPGAAFGEAPDWEYLSPQVIRVNRSFRMEPGTHWANCFVLSLGQATVRVGPDCTVSDCILEDIGFVLWRDEASLSSVTNNVFRFTKTPLAPGGWRFAGAMDLTP